MWIPRVSGFAELSGPSLARPGRVDPASGFGAALGKADASFGERGHPEDEAEAQRELTEILVALEAGRVEGLSLAAKVGPTPGTNRRLVESLKAFLGHWTGLPRAQQEGAGPSLNVLWYSLPLAYRTLLFRVFPDLKLALQAEQARLLHRSL